MDNEPVVNGFDEEVRKDALGMSRILRGTVTGILLFVGQFCAKITA